MRTSTSRSMSVLAALGLAAGLLPGVARAQSFPTAAWAPLYCQRGLMTDGYRDQSGAVDERDIVGRALDPAAFRAVDAQFLYLRLRLDGSPAQAVGLRPFAWGFQISTDGDASDYELLIGVDGGSGTVVLYQNTATTIANSPLDPAEQLVASYPFAQNGRVTDAGASLSGGGQDSFLELAVPWTDLTPLGLTPATLVAVWAASSTNIDRLNGDFACHDGGGGGDSPTLSGGASAPVAADPGRSPGPVGGDAGGGGGASSGGGNLIGSSGIEGGPGCSCAAGSAGSATGSSALLVAAAALLRRRRRVPLPR